MSAWMSCSSSSLGLSVYVLAATLVAQLVLGVTLAWVLARKRFPGHGLLDSLVSLPLVFPPIVIGYLLLLALGRQGWLASATGWSPNIVFQPAALLIDQPCQILTHDGLPAPAPLGRGRLLPAL